MESGEGGIGVWMMASKPKSLWIVVPHCENRKPTGRGYVAREAREGNVLDQYNYGGIPAVCVCSRKHDAERRADKLSFGK